MSRDQQPSELSERDYRTILAENVNHGRSLATDLYVAEKYGPEVFVTPPSTLPAAVRPGFNFRIIADREPIPDVQVAFHGSVARYNKTLDSNGHVLSIERREEPNVSGHEKGEAHYHVSSLGHWYQNRGLGLDVMPLTVYPQKLETFDAAFDVLNREVLLYRGDLDEQVNAAGNRANVPPKDLGVATLREFIMGFREGVREFKGDMVERVEVLLDRLPVL